MFSFDWYLLKGELLQLLLVILESEVLSTRIQIFLNPHLFFWIQEFSHPHVSVFKSNLPVDMYPTGVQIHFSTQHSSGNIANRVCILKHAKFASCSALREPLEWGCHLEYSIHSKELGSILLTINSLYRKLQSSYHQHHSMETASLKVMNDVLLNMSIPTFCWRDLTWTLECAVLRSAGFAHIPLVNANKSVLMVLCPINAILTVVHLRGPV